MPKRKDERKISVELSEREFDVLRTLVRFYGLAGEVGRILGIPQSQVEDAMYGLDTRFEEMADK